MIGNDCVAVLELNDIPCAPGFRVVRNNNNWSCSAETANNELWDGFEAAFGVERGCFNLIAPADGATLITGSMQEITHTKDWNNVSVTYDTKAGADYTTSTLPQWQC